MTRTFTAVEPSSEETPFSIGLMGPPGGGKTYSALELATGIVSVRGGEIRLIDTENRAHKYRDSFRYKVVPFEPPFRPGDFLAAIVEQVADGAGCIIVDSASDEHEGVGGVLDWKEEEVDRIAGKNADYGRREACAMAGWIKPKRDRLKFINGIQRIKVPLILCFRAREKTKPIKEGNKTVPTNVGWQPIAPSEIVHAMDLTCLLAPRADGVPTWKSDKAGEDFIIKLPLYLRPFIEEGKPLSRGMGEAFARWARGDTAASTASRKMEPQTSAPPSDPDPLDSAGIAAASKGEADLRLFWNNLTPTEKKIIGGAAKLAELKQVAAKSSQQLPLNGEAA